ncbi:MAG TPA: response regulator [Planctomycetota bacterium]|jgi:DNA-binding NtrC family response regulator
MDKPAVPILIIDDDADTISALETALMKEGYSPTACLNLHSATEYLAKEEPAIVFLDYFLAGDNPAQFVREAKAKYPDLLIVLMTGAHNAAQCASNIGLAFYLQKPFDLGQFLTVLERALGRRELPIGAS